MKLSPTRSPILAALLSIAVARAASGASTISGVVRDAQGAPLAGAAVTATSHQTPPVDKATTTSAGGEYRFTALEAGAYTLRAELHGYTAGASRTVQVQPALDGISVDLTLIRADSGQAPPRPALQLQASGLHGLIDPGGYSASTIANAASGLVRGIAEVNRSDGSIAAAEAKDWPCALEPELRKAAQERSDEAAANRRLGEFYVAHDRPALAIPLLKRALQIDSSDRRASRALGLAWLESGEFEQARSLFAALAGDHDEAESHMLLAKADEGLGMFPQAAQEYRIADREESSEKSVLGVGYELILSGSPADAATVFLAGARKYPQSVSLRIGAGTAQFLLNRSAESIESFLGATDVDPSDPRPYAFLSAAAGVSDAQSERVRNSFKRYLERMPNSAAANYYNALALSRNDAEADGAGVETLLKRAVQLDPALSRAHLLLADAYASRGDYLEAIPEYETTVRLEPGLSDAHYRLAMAYKRAGRVDDWAREIKLFQQASPGKSLKFGGDGIDIAQFISVMQPLATRTNPETQCDQAAR